MTGGLFVCWTGSRFDDAGVADHWGQLAGDAQRQGTPVPVIDGLLAATALHHHLTMVTRNVQDFMVHNNIQAFNPWDTP